MTAAISLLEERLRRRQARVAVVGLGAVGLPLAAAFARAGLAVLGLDRDAELVARLARGERTLGYLSEAVHAVLLEPGRFEPTTDGERLGEADAICVCVPTPLGPGREPDLSCVRAAAETAARSLRPGQLVVLESTTWPGTTRDVVGPILAASGLAAGRDYLLAYSPEREDPGRRDWSTRTTPRLVGGTCAESTRLAALLFEIACEDVRPVAGAEVAEAAKLFENVFRSVNIALVNEVKVALDALGVDVWEVLDAAASKPFGFMRFDPGPGMGGSCIPVDPFYLSWIARRAGAEPRLIETAGEINTAMPEYVVRRLAAALAGRGGALRGARVLVLGLAYKRDVDVVTETPGLRLIELLRAAGAEVAYTDPHVRLSPAVPGRGDRLRSQELTPELFERHDACVLMTDHAAFDYDLIAERARLLVDTRNALAGRMAGTDRYVRA